MSSFVITNTGSIPIKIAGVELAGDNTCRGCPIEHLDKIEAPKDATYFITYCGKPSIITHIDDGEGGTIAVSKEQPCDPITFNGKTMKAGERTEVITLKEDLKAVVEEKEAVK